MTDSASTPTGAGYQPDGANQDQPKPGEQTQDTQPQGGGQQEQTTEGGDVKKGENQGNPLTALVQNRRDSRDQADQYRQEIADLRAQINGMKTGPADNKAWTNPYDATDQPVDHLRAELEHTRAEMEQLKADGSKELEDTKNMQALASFEQAVAQEISQAAQTTPELLPAYGFVNAQITNMHKGQGLSGAQLANAVRNSLLQAFVNGQSHGNSHAETVAQMALNMGFQAAASQAPNPAARGQKAAQQSLGGATSGGGGATPPGAEQLAKMSRADLRKDSGAALSRIKEMLQGRVPIE